jgi:hypothetical protein
MLTNNYQKTAIDSYAPRMLRVFHWIAFGLPWMAIGAEYDRPLFGFVVGERSQNKVMAQVPVDRYRQRCDSLGVASRIMGGVNRDGAILKLTRGYFLE